MSTMSTITQLETSMEQKQVLKTEPRVTAITCYYTIQDRISYTKLDRCIADLVESTVDIDTLSSKCTKTKSQLTVPLGYTLDDCTVYMRMRFNEYIKNDRKRGNFQNQICFYYKDKCNKSKCFKVFRNGVIHVTGFTNEVHMDECVKQFVEKLAMVILGYEEYEVVFVERKVCLVNVSFRLKCGLSLAMVYQMLQQHAKVIYDPEIYCGLMVHTMGFKASIFRSGAIIITGAKSVEDAKCAFDKCLQVVQEHITRVPSIQLG